jgi:hypothetical protein
LREAWACDATKDPRLAESAAANALTVATPAIFIRGGELEKVMEHFYEEDLNSRI